MLSLLFVVTVLVPVSFFMEFSEVLICLGGVLSVMVFMFMGSEGVVSVSSLFVFDEMSMLLSVLSVWISVFMVVASAKMDAKNSRVFFFFVSMMLCMLLYCFSVYNLVGFYLFFESVLVPIFMIIYGWGGQPERVQAGIYMLMYTLFGSLPLLLILLSVNSHLSLSFIYLFYGESINFGVGCLIMFLLAFLIKVPMFTLHLWLPKAHVEAPVAGSMMLAGVLLKLGGYGIYRVGVLILSLSLFELDYFIFSVSLVGAVYVGFICLRQVDIKSLIAYSSVCHMSLVIGGLFCGSVWSSHGVLVLMLGHGLCSSALFCLANMMYERFYTRSLMLMKGMIIFFPSLTLWWFIFSVINMGAPPSMNLMGEIFLMGSILNWSLTTIVVLFLLSFFGACYSLYLFSFTQHGKSWFCYGVDMISMREYLLLYGHLFPIILYVLKVDVFTNWI